MLRSHGLEQTRKHNAAAPSSTLPAQCGFQRGREGGFPVVSRLVVAVVVAAVVVVVVVVVAAMVVIVAVAIAVVIFVTSSTTFIAFVVAVAVGVIVIVIVTPCQQTASTSAWYSWRSLGQQGAVRQEGRRGGALASRKKEHWDGSEHHGAHGTTNVEAHKQLTIGTTAMLLGSSRYLANPCGGGTLCRARRYRDCSLAMSMGNCVDVSRLAWWYLAKKLRRPSSPKKPSMDDRRPLVQNMEPSELLPSSSSLRLPQLLPHSESVWHLDSTICNGRRVLAAKGVQEVVGLMPWAGLASALRNEVNELDAARARLPTLTGREVERGFRSCRATGPAVALSDNFRDCTTGLTSGSAPRDPPETPPRAAAAAAAPAAAPSAPFAGPPSGRNSAHTEWRVRRRCCRREFKRCARSSASDVIGPTDSLVAFRIVCRRRRSCASNTNWSRSDWRLLALEKRSSAACSCGGSGSAAAGAHDSMPSGVWGQQKDKYTTGDNTHTHTNALLIENKRTATSRFFNSATHTNTRQRRVSLAPVATAQ